MRHYDVAVGRSDDGWFNARVVCGIGEVGHWEDRFDLSDWQARKQAATRLSRSSGAPFSLILSRLQDEWTREVVRPEVEFGRWFA